MILFWCLMAKGEKLRPKQMDQLIEAIFLHNKKDRPCAACQAGKQVGSTHHNKNVMTTSRALELLHMDLFGPVAYLSIGGSKYCGGQIPPGPLEGKKASRKAPGLLLRKAIPSWARGGTFNRTNQHEDGSTRAHTVR